MPLDPTTAMARARANYRYLAEADNEAALERLKAGADGFNRSLHIAKVIDDEQLKQLSAELEETCESQRRDLKPE